ncbi:MAG TPA: aspartate-semialdehyde dehydrogenase [Candidatus Deferrimicrobiaceae bacterium]|nr:aspartate-semialdehyde dehydrogenase [Candidatus Deferrimicrobiaceae bacterium]
MGTKRFNVAVAGATGAVGEVMLRILEERKFPLRNLRLLASERSVGKRIRFKGEDVPVELLQKSAFKGIDVALFSAGASRSKEFAGAAWEAGAVVVDNSSAFRMEPDIPLVVPEINGEEIAQYRNRGIIANPNCTTIIAIMPLKPLHDYGTLKRVVASSYQATSGAGAKAMAELIAQTKAFARGEDLEVAAFKHQIAFNVIPHIDAFLENGYTKEEMKMTNEGRKILGIPDLRVTCTTVRVPVLTAHSVSINAQFERKITREKARELIAAFPGCQVMDDPGNNVYPMPLFCAGKDDCYVGRIREDESAENALNFWVCGDQLRKGAALNAIQIAEVLAQKYLQPAAV